MIDFHGNNFRSGSKVIYEDEPYIIECSEFVKPGKGRAFVRVKMRSLINRKRLEKTFKSCDSLKDANVFDATMNYIYKDDNFFYFLNPDTLDQINIEEKVVGCAEKWLLVNIACIIKMWNGIPIQVIPPNFVIIKVEKTDLSLKSDTVGGGNKSATLITGAIIKVPFFIQEGDFIKVDTRSSEYISRAK